MAVALRLFFAAGIAITAGSQSLCQAQPPGLTAKAKTDFEAVDRAPRPALKDTLACEQSQAALLPVTRPESRYLVYYRKAYCELFGAALWSDAPRFQLAAQGFAEAIANWPKKTTDRTPSGLRALMYIARLENGRMADSYPDMERDLKLVVAAPSCVSTLVMEASLCNAVIQTARTWLGWLAYRKNDFEQAWAILQPLGTSTWALLSAGARARQGGRAAEEAELLSKAAAQWAAAEQSPSPDITTLLGPKPDPAAIYHQVGLAQFSLRQYDAAIPNFDTAVRLAPRNSHALFLRAQAKEALGLFPPALTDYKLAADAGHGAAAAGWPLGLAAYRSGLLLYRQRRFAEAAEAFSTALGAPLGDVQQADVTAWRMMAIVAGGGCKTTADLLDSSLTAASGSFPKTEGTTLLFDCRLEQAANPDQLVALHNSYSTRLTPEQLTGLKLRIANGFADQGVAAEDRKDPYSAVVAYRRALEWNPANAKARFNLGAIYIEDKRFHLAEVEYRALVAADAKDLEAAYWLAESILAQKPSPNRQREACGLLLRAQAMDEPDKKSLVATALAAARCAN